jgi:hypothetical protein
VEAVVVASMSVLMQVTGKKIEDNIIGVVKLHYNVVWSGCENSKDL